jgi:hypothetical protein
VGIVQLRVNHTIKDLLLFEFHVLLGINVSICCTALFALYYLTPKVAENSVVRMLQLGDFIVRSIYAMPDLYICLESHYQYQFPLSTIIQRL